MEVNVSKLKEFGELYKVLYVEDDEIIRDQTKNFLGRFFKHVDVAEDGSLGLEQYQKESYDIVVTDINMPNMNGIEMIERIKELNEEQVILVTSAHNDSENLLRLINLHIMRFVLKPFDFKQFIIMLYHIVEELHNKTRLKKMQERLNESAKMAQSIVDTINVGVVVLENTQLKMANKAFLDMYGFDSFETLKLEMPEIGILFQKFKLGIDVETNAELINELQTRPAEEHRIRILQTNLVHEYQVKMTALGEKEYLLSFTDISALHKKLTQDIHTKLPHRQATLGKIDSFATLSSKLYCYLITMNHFESVLQWYGKAAGIELEAEMAEKLQGVLQKEMARAEVGYFGVNQFLVISESDDDINFIKEVKNIDFVHNTEVQEKHVKGNMNFRIEANIQKVVVDVNNSSRDDIEIELMNAFDELSIYYKGD